MFMTHVKIILIVLFSLTFQSVDYAYYETHPPYQFKKGPFKHFPDKPLSGDNIPSFIKKDIQPMYLGPEVYQIDVDRNGIQDYVSFVYPGASTLLNEIHIYLKKPNGRYERISFSEDAGAGIEDIVDINNDGKWEVILTDLHEGKKHNYIAYSIYEFKDYRLVNADKKFKGFPKFVWFTDKNNDKDTVHLTAEERKKHVSEKDASIQYTEIK